MKLADAKVIADELVKKLDAYCDGRKLYNAQGKVVPTPSEEALFEAVGIEYLNPQQRTTPLPSNIYKL
jgi:DNA polymerase/3'-5' exonuclease PolX